MLDKIRRRKPASRTILIRELALQYALLEAARHVREVGGNNRGPRVRQYLKLVGLGEGFAWCDAFVSWCLHRAAGHRLPIESAGVGVTYTRARSLRWLVTRPLRADLVLFDFNGNGAFDDHIGFVERVLSVKGLFWILRTVEGNTSSGQAGSQGDGAGVYRRYRVVRKRQVAFVRVPGRVLRPSIRASV